MLVNSNLNQSPEQLAMQMGNLQPGMTPPEEDGGNYDPMQTPVSEL